MRTVLLTGGTGSVGMNVCLRLLDEGIDVVLFARHRPRDDDMAEMRNRPGAAHFFQGDVLDPAALPAAIEKHRVTDLIHGAAATPNAATECDQAGTVMNVNCLGVVAALDAARKHLPGRFILLGSISAYGRTAMEAAPLVEDVSVADPQSLYELSKFTAERIVLRYHRALGMPAFVARIGDVFGPWEHYSGVRPLMSFPYQTTAIAQNGGVAVLPRPCVMDWIYGTDIAGAVFALLTAKAPRFPVYPMSSGFRWPLSDWCELLKRRYPGFEYRIDGDPARATIKVNQTNDNAAMSTERMAEDLGFVPQFDLERSFEDYMAWLDRHPGYLARQPAAGKDGQ